MARKGDSVAATMETLMSLRFRQGNGNKVYSGNVTNGKDFLPIHIAAMSTRCPQNILRILRNDYEQSLYGRTSDGSLPLHLVSLFMGGLFQTPSTFTLYLAVELLPYREVL